jgi:hypothetical protein
MSCGGCFGGDPAVVDKDKRYYTHVEATLRVKLESLEGAPAVVVRVVRGTGPT